ncbi:MAG: thiamine pyrophosphate-dependent enzyme [Nocardioides sp.]|jgi:2-oxoisovalerate dehydrogenase E1 component
MIDQHFRDQVLAWSQQPPSGPVPSAARQTLDALFTAQLRSRHVDFAARELQKQGRAFYTISSAGHEANAAVALALRPSDPALLHYRSGAFFAARAGQVAGSAIDDLLLSHMCGVDDPISGGRHKVIGHPDLAIIPQTSTIASHLPRALGVAFTIGRTRTRWPRDAVVVTSFGDASANHSTATGAFNAAGYLSHQGVPLPLLFVCEDNGIGISVRTPAGWTARSLASHPAIDYHFADGSDPDETLRVCHEVVASIRERRRPAILHLKTVRFLGHAGSDAEIAYRSSKEIAADHPLDPLLGTARALILAGVDPADVAARYEDVRREVAEAATSLPVTHLATPAEVMAPLVATSADEVAKAATLSAGRDRRLHVHGNLPEEGPPLTLAQSINAALTDLMAYDDSTLVFGEDVGVKGGVYGVTRGLRKRFGASRVFDTLLDEQTILGVALGAGVSGALPIPEIQYLAYLHNAEDQLRGEAASLRFFSNGQFQNPMVVRIAGLAYQRGFGGHFHNDNSVAVLRDIPGLILGVPSCAAEAPRMLRTMAALARVEGRVCVLLEPIALYHSRDVVDGDGGLLASYAAPEAWEPIAELGRTTLYADGAAVDTLVITFGNGVHLSRRAVHQAGVPADVLDLRWLSPLPVEEMCAHAARYSRVVVADETRHSGGVAEGIVAALVDAGYDGTITRLNSEDTFIPLGPGAATVLLSEDQIVAALRG